MRSLLAMLAIFASTFVATVVVRVAVVDELAQARRQARHGDDVLRSPGPELLALASLEHEPAWADVLWLQIVQDLGARSAASYDRVERWANIAVDLDPRYFNVYYASSVHLLVYARRIEAVDALLEKGVRNLPNQWELPFLLGYNAYFMKGNAEEAAVRWEAAAKLPNAARFVASLAARARAQAGDEQGAIAMLRSMMEYLSGPALDDAKIRLKILESEATLRAYDDACQRFLAARGRRPADGAELFREGFATEPPVDRLNAPITIDPCRAGVERMTRPSGPARVGARVER
ncbi:hypothetical protein L6R52_43475 [Myxococcota bacterium]|nr:hypothetical protein [Myxococcota bacterium]